jgi:DNA-binding MarR family transcriptional regulator
MDGFAVALLGTSAQAEAAVASAGGRIGARMRWGGDVAAATARVLVIEACGVDDAVLDAALPAIAASMRDVAVVATIDAAQIDRVAAALLGPRTTLLCDPTPADRIAALVLAARARGLPGSVREGGDEGERLRALHAEVARIAALLAGLAEEPETAASTVDDRRGSYGAEPAETPIDPAEIRRAIRARRLRAQYFDPRLLEDPGWDMLLDLFASELEGGQVSVSSLCIAAAVAPTTALRWITRLIATGLFVRVADNEDRRRAFLVLAPAASAAMHAYCTAIRRAGLAIA